MISSYPLPKHCVVSKTNPIQSGFIVATKVQRESVANNRAVWTTYGVFETLAEAKEVYDVSFEVRYGYPGNIRIYKFSN